MVPFQSHFCLKLFQEIYRLSILCSIWSLKAPRVLAFGWLAVLTTILTKVHVWRCKKIIVDACPTDARSVDLPFNCKVAQILWKSALRLTDYNWVLPNHFLHLF